jgi:polyprenyl-phospho-N-acetylgalactosaminyl synthase
VKQPDTYIIIPVYNEANVISGVIRDLQGSFGHVVCIDDGSTDQSASEVAAAGAKLIRHPINLGQGAGLQTGIEYALSDPHAKYFVTFDADGQHRTSDAVRMVELLRKGEYDVILGSRFLGEASNMPPLKRTMLRAAARFSNLISGTHLTDAHNGLRAFNRTFAERLHITMNDYAHATEIIMQVGNSGLRIEEVPVNIDYTEYSKAKGQSIWNSINILFDVILKYILGGRHT